MEPADHEQRHRRSREPVEELEWFLRKEILVDQSSGKCLTGEAGGRIFGCSVWGNDASSEAPYDCVLNLGIGLVALQAKYSAERSIKSSLASRSARYLGRRPTIVRSVHSGESCQQPACEDQAMLCPLSTDH